MANKTAGWISVYRSIRDHWIWKDETSYNRVQAWLDLLLEANFEDKKILVNGKLVKIKRGQMWTSVRTLADRWGWSKNRVVAFLELLQGDTMVTVKGTQNGTLLTIVNYEEFQNQQDTDKDADEDTDEDTEGTRKGRKNNYNNINNIINNKGRFTPPTKKDIVAYCFESGHDIDADAFIDFYESKNWMVGKNKMKDWKAAVRNWERHDKERPRRTERTFQNFEPSGTDYDAIVDAIMYGGN